MFFIASATFFAFSAVHCAFVTAITSSAADVLGCWALVGAATMRPPVRATAARAVRNVIKMSPRESPSRWWTESGGLSHARAGHGVRRSIRQNLLSRRRDSRILPPTEGSGTACSRAHRCRAAMGIAACTDLSTALNRWQGARGRGARTPGRHAGMARSGSRRAQSESLRPAFQAFRSVSSASGFLSIMQKAHATL